MPDWLILLCIDPLLRSLFPPSLLDLVSTPVSPDLVLLKKWLVFRFREFLLYSLIFFPSNLICGNTGIFGFELDFTIFVLGFEEFFISGIFGLEVFLIFDVDFVKDFKLSLLLSLLLLCKLICFRSTINLLWYFVRPCFNSGFSNAFILLKLPEDMECFKYVRRGVSVPLNEDLDLLVFKRFCVIGLDSYFLCQYDESMRLLSGEEIAQLSVFKFL